MSTPAPSCAIVGRAMMGSLVFPRLAGAVACGLTALIACTNAERAEKDAGTREAGARDAAVYEDAAALDAGVRDAGRPDAGSSDGGLADAGRVEDAGTDGGTPAPAPREYGLERRVENTSCWLDGTPPLAVVPVATAAAFPQVQASGAIALSRAGGKLVLVERAGRVRGFTAAGDGADAATVLDLGSAVRTDGLRGAALRPDGGALVVSYLPADDPLRIVVARFELDSAGVAKVASQEVLLTVPLVDAARAGGALAFLFDGTLVIAFGDGGDASTPTDPGVLAGKLARIDVSAASGFAIPSDNPFVTDPTVHDAIHALGLEAPTSCTVDRITGQLWCADAGGATRDRILLVTAGATLRPLLSYPRVGCGAIVGFVSRDAVLPDLQGVLVFGDGCSAALRGMRFDGSLVRAEDAVATLPASLAAFGEDADGRMLAADQSGQLHALVRPATPAPSFPTTVGATGCLLATREPAPSLVPFEVRAPLWSDDAHKRRFVVLPEDGTIDFTTEGAWGFPVGTIFMKEFLLDDDDDPSTPERIMETRFLVKRTESAWEGYSYMWDRESKDAFLLEGAEIGRYPMRAGTLDVSGASVHRHTFPDRSQCLLCHNAAAGRALGLQTGRMNTEHDYGGFVDNQLRAMEHVGLFTDPLPKSPDELPRFAEPSDESAALGDRARAWLYANCSHCHRPGGPTPVALDLRYEIPLEATNACGITPDFPLVQIPDAKIIEPGDADHSELFFRLSVRDQNQMPPIATLITEPVGVDVVGRFIDALLACP